MNYKVGDTVMCIDAKPTQHPGYTILKAGECYQVLAISKTCCGHMAVDVGAANQSGNTLCVVCGNTFPGAWHYTWRFIKLEPPAIKARSEPALVEAE